MSEQPINHFPVRPDLEQLKHQAKDLLKAKKANETEAEKLFSALKPDASNPPQLSDAQFVLARSYGLASWPRLVTACNLIEAIWANDLETIRQLILREPSLLHEDARGVKGNWGPPMSYAANLGRDEVIDLLKSLGSEDVQFAFDRACLQGRLATARKLFDLGARPEPGCLMGPCETLNGDGLAFLLELGASVADEKGDSMAPIGLLLQTYSRNASGKHACFAALEAAGVLFPDTPTMALHRGRLDLLKSHLAKDPDLLSRTFSHHEIYPLELGCSPDPTFALHGSPIAGGGLLHMAVDYEEFEIAEWILEMGRDPNLRASFDEEGFGGQTPLFGTVVSQPFRVDRKNHERFAELLLRAGADPTARASLRKELRFVSDESLHEYRDVSVIEWGERFHDQDWVNPAAMKLIRAAAEAKGS